MNYVESLSQEIKELDNEIKEIKREIEKYWPGVNSENGRDRTLQKLNEDLQQTENETKRYEAEYMDTIKTINSLKIGIKSIFDRIGCNTDQAQEIIGSHGVSESNML